MHELSMMCALVEQVEDIAVQQCFDRVYEIRLSVGELSGVEPASLEFCFSEATQGSVLSGAKLILQPVGVELSCLTCGEVSRPSDISELVCSHCQSFNVKVCKGREFKVEEMEVD
jgi:hydrogenase nickel incorporation protein HypA/HybF